MWFFSALKSWLPISPSMAESIQHFCIDSRQALPNSLFFALKGAKVDGHQFLQQAYENGAKVAIVEKVYASAPSGLLQVPVNSTLATLQEMAQAVVAFWKPKIIGITGSVGKTSTKDFLIEMLKKHATLTGTPGNYNSQLTMPLTILNAQSPTEFLVLEMGIDRPYEMERHVQIAPPNFSILTMLGHAHVEAFTTFENFARAKMKIFSPKSVEMGLYNQDMPLSDQVQLIQNKKMVSYSLQNPQANYYLKLKKNHFEIFKDQKFLLSSSSPLFDHKSHYNLLAAVAMANYLGVSNQNIVEASAHLKLAKNRMEKIHRGKVTFICDAYNSNLDSLENALEVLSQFDGRKIAIISDLVDQGLYYHQNHLKIAKLALQHADICIGFGEGLQKLGMVWRKSQKRWAFFLSYSNMLPYISNLIRPGDIVLLKGSRKRALERVLHDIDFDTVAKKSAAKSTCSF